MSASYFNAFIDFLALQKDQWLSPDRLADLQWRRFKKILDHAYRNTSFYRKRFDAAGITPDHIHDRNDLSRIPITTREDLRNPDALIATGLQKSSLKSSTTSGSSGRRTTTYFDGRAWLMGKLILKLRARLACGMRPWDKIAILSEEKHPASWFRELLLRRKVIFVLDSDKNFIVDLEKYNPSALYGFPSFFSVFNEQDTSIRPKSIFTSSEMLDAKTRINISRKFNADIFDIYGCTEVKEISWECPEHEGYHINSDRLLVEFIHTDQRSENDHAGIIVSSLYNYGMPLIRYEVGDTGHSINRLCSCGRGLPLMVPTMGRSVDYFQLPDGSMISPYKMTCAIENIEGMKQYQIRQERIDKVVVVVVPEEIPVGPITENVTAALAKILPGTSIEVKTVATIAKEKNGKYRIVRSDINKENLTNSQ